MEKTSKAAAPREGGATADWTQSGKLSVSDTGSADCLADRRFPTALAAAASHVHVLASGAKQKDAGDEHRHALASRWRVRAEKAWHLLRTSVRDRASGLPKRAS